MDNIIMQFIIDNIEILYILVFAIFLGMEVISKVPTVLHTPLMSGANAISGVVVIGAIILIRNADPNNYIILIIGMLGIALA
ncbi:MAG: NAD(P) transhydrogenase subunit alpha, partial [Cyclobacteriaceae bacterium]|nr:NAD(P) transhydrogenase subunit alpha [Cyclobacteriaceae bacterium]